MGAGRSYVSNFRRRFIFPFGVKCGEQPVGGKPSGVDSGVLHSIANTRLVIQFVLAWRLLPFTCLLRIRRVDGESSLSSTSVGMDTTSGDLAVRVLRNPVAYAPGSSVALGSGWRSASALWTDAEWPGHRRQRWHDASCRNALHPASRQLHVAGSDIENAAAIFGRPSAAGNVQRRRSRDALRGHPHCCDFPTSLGKQGKPGHPISGWPEPCPPVAHKASCKSPF